jgi:CASPASE and TPR Repeat-Associated N-terminal domain/CASPASE and TPR Repeat-Associated C-terminal domain/CAP12/Pycsar effector protein, TIR domain
MPTSPVVDQEFAVHLFAPSDGPRAQEAYHQVQRVWTACREQLGMTQQIAGLPGSALPAPGALGGPVTDTVLAAQESQACVRQAVLRHVHDVLNLSVTLAQRRLGWADYAAIWARASQPQADALLGEAHLFLARTPPGKTGRVAATAELGQVLDALLPYREDRPQQWWRWGSTTPAGFALWDTGLAADTSAVREIVLVAAADQDQQLSTWAWSDGTPAMPPFARYLMHAAKLRYEARLLDRWHTTPPGPQDIDALLAELNAALEPGEATPDMVGLLHSLRGRLRAEDARLTALEADLASLAQTVSLAQGNLAAQPGCADDDATGMFAADQSLAHWLTGQVQADRAYLQIQSKQVRNVRELVAEELRVAGGPRPAAPLASPPRSGDPDTARRVFVVYGRDGALTKSFFDLLYAVGLEPLEWERLVGPTGTSTPYLGQVVRKAPHLAQATLVLLSPDDIVELHPDLCLESDHRHERGRAGQARPNVLFELGLAFMAYPESTVIAEVGRMRPISDLAGLNVIRFDGSPISVKKVLDRLILAGCPVNMSGTSWLDPDRFAHLTAYHRGPDTAGTNGDART